LRPRSIYLLNQANQAIRMQLEQELRAVGLTGIQYTVLSIVGSREGISSAELSRRFFVTQQSMIEIVSGLERRKLLRRAPSPQSRRILAASLTEAGRQALAAADTIADAIERAVFAALSDDDFVELRRILSELLRDLRASHASSLRPLDTPK
jgi:DNA-binding MarR family transcriptional regulator